MVLFLLLRSKTSIPKMKVWILRKYLIDLYFFIFWEYKKSINDKIKYHTHWYFVFMGKFIKITSDDYRVIVGETLRIVQCGYEDFCSAF